MEPESLDIAIQPPLVSLYPGLLCCVLNLGDHLPWAAAASSLPVLSIPAGKWQDTEPKFIHVCSLTSHFGLLEELAVSTEPVPQPLCRVLWERMAQFILCPPHLCCTMVTVQHHCWDATLSPLCLAGTPVD